MKKMNKYKYRKLDKVKNVSKDKIMVSKIDIRMH